MPSTNSKEFRPNGKWDKKWLQHHDPVGFKGSLHEALTKDSAVAIRLLKALFGHWVTAAQSKQLPTQAYYKTPNNMKTYYLTWMKKLNNEKMKRLYEFFR